MRALQTIVNAIMTLTSGPDLRILGEVSTATGVSVLRLMSMSRSQIVGCIRDAGIPLSTIPPHIEHALGLVRAN